MGYRRKWKPSKAQTREFAETMDKIHDFCAENNICESSTNDSYYFTINGIGYRVSNHTIASSNARAYDDMGNQVRDLYHPNGEDGVVCITASKTKIIEIYNNLKAGYRLDRRGRRVD